MRPAVICCVIWRAVWRVEERRGGIGGYFTDIPKEGFDPVRGEKVMTMRRESFVDDEIPIGEEYREFVLRFPDGISSRVCKTGG